MKIENKIETKKDYNFKSIRVKGETKSKADQKLKLVNKAENCGTVNYDMLINFLIEKLTTEDIKELQKSTITWEHEEVRLKAIYSKKKGKISDVKWKELLFTGQLQAFVAEHSRISA